MSDPFGDAFGSAPANNQTTNDAGADFLNQQADEMNALENQFGVSETVNPVEGEADFFAAAAPSEPVKNVNDGNDSDIDINADDDEVVMGQSEAAPVVAAAPTDFGAIVMGEGTNFSTQNSVSASSITQPKTYDIKVESENIAKWKKEFSQRLEDLDEKETKQMVELEEKAKKDLEDWRKSRQEALEKQRQLNLENEQSFIDERESRSKEGSGEIDWCKVSNLCDFNNKNKKSKDTTRMKSLFLQMKGDQLKS